MKSFAIAARHKRVIGDTAQEQRERDHIVNLEFPQIDDRGDQHRTEHDDQRNQGVVLGIHNKIS